MRDGIQSFASADGRHKYQRVGWCDGQIVWRMWSSWSNSRGVIDWMIVKSRQAEIAERLLIKD